MVIPYESTPAASPPKTTMCVNGGSLRAGTQKEQRRPGVHSRDGACDCGQFDAYCAGVSSVILVCATVQPGSPTLKREKRRTEMFSCSLPTFCATSCEMLMAWSLMKGCSYRQTSS